MKTRIYVMRHGQSTNNRDNIVSGYYADPALTEEGIRQAKATREKLRHVTFDVVYSSDLQRAAHTAQIVSGRDEADHPKLESLRERKFGKLEKKPGHHLAELRKQHEKTYNALTDDERFMFKYANDMESDHEVSTRFLSALTQIAEDHPGKTILVAAHGGTLRTLLIKIGFARLHELTYGTIDNAAYAEVIYEDGQFSVGETGGIHPATS